MALLAGTTLASRASGGGCQDPATPLPPERQGQIVPFCHLCIVCCGLFTPYVHHGSGKRQI
jgi:hypothetical protein